MSKIMDPLSPSDWCVFLDGDTLFLQPDFGHQISRHILAHPSTGLFTCYASRCHYRFQVPDNIDMNNDSIVYHRHIARNLAISRKGIVSPINHRIAGHLMAIQKSTWTQVLPTIQRTASQKQILGVDTKISKAVLAAGLTILLMEDVYLFHYCRLLEGFDFTSHLT